MRIKEIFSHKKIKKEGHFYADYNGILLISFGNLTINKFYPNTI